MLRKIIAVSLCVLGIASGCGIPTTIPILNPLSDSYVIPPLTTGEDTFQFAYTAEVGEDSSVFRGITIFYKIYPDTHATIASDKTAIEDNDHYGSVSDIEEMGFHKLSGYGIEPDPETGLYTTVQNPLISVGVELRGETIYYRMNLAPDTGRLELNADDEALLVAYRYASDSDPNDETTLKGFLLGDISLDDDDLYDPDELFGETLNYDLSVIFYAFTFGFDNQNFTPIYSEPVNLGKLLIINNLAGQPPSGEETETGL